MHMMQDVRSGLHWAGDNTISANMEPKGCTTRPLNMSSARKTRQMCYMCRLNDNTPDGKHRQWIRHPKLSYEHWVEPLKGSRGHRRDISM